MNLITRIVLGLVKLALLIGVAGGLIDLTQTMRGPRPEFGVKNS